MITIWIEGSLDRVMHDLDRAARSGPGDHDLDRPWSGPGDRDLDQAKRQD